MKIDDHNIDSQNAQVMTERGLDALRHVEIVSLSMIRRRDLTIVYLFFLLIDLL